MLGLLGLALAAEPAPPITLQGGLYNDPSVRVGDNGVMHLMLGPKNTRTKMVVVQEGKDNRLRYVKLEPDGTSEQTRLPGPGRKWDEKDRFRRVILDLDAKGKPVVAILGTRCRDNNDCSDKIWVSQKKAKKWTTQALSMPDGNYMGLALAGGGPDGWTVISRFKEVGQGQVTVNADTLKKLASGEQVDDGLWSGMMRWDGGTEGKRWFTTKKAARPQRGVWLGKGKNRELALVYKVRSKLWFHGPQGKVQVAKSAYHHPDAVVLPDGRVHFQYYDARDKALQGGIVDPGSNAFEEASRMDSPESGWFNAVASMPDGGSLAAWYYHRNNYNKGVRMALNAPGETSWAPWTTVRSADENIGWWMDMDVGADGTVGLAAVDRSNQHVNVYRFGGAQAARGQAIAPAGDWTDNRRWIFLFGYGGGFFAFTNILTRPPDAENVSFNDVDSLTGNFEITPGLALEAGFAGKIGPVNLVAEFMRRNDGDEAVQRINKLQQRAQRIAGKLGLDDFPMPDSQMQLHFSTVDQAGSFTAIDGEETEFRTAGREVELRYVGKEGYHFGLRYHSFAGPQDVYIANSDGSQLLNSFVADGAFTEGSLVAGWSVLDYLKKYEVQHFGPYLDAQIGIGYVDVTLTAEDEDTRDTFAIAVPAKLDLGIVAYKRARKLQGLGGFVRVGARGIGQYTGLPGASSESEDPDAEVVLFNRIETRYGPYANAGLVF